MKMIENVFEEMYVTGDIHKEIARFYAPGYGIKQTLEQGDILFVCGDFGFAGEEEYLDSLAELPYMIAFCDGNHENFPALGGYPIELWNGGRIHRLRSNVIHLMRGQVYEVNGVKIFVMGGGYSIDRDYYKEGEHWWQEEMPSEEEYEEAWENLEKCGYQVDYILTHTAPMETLLGAFRKSHKGEGRLNAFLDQVRDRVSYKHWYFGHLHEDRDLWRNQTVLWTDIRVLETGEIVSFL